MGDLQLIVSFPYSPDCFIYFWLNDICICRFCSVLPLHCSLISFLTLSYSMIFSAWRCCFPILLFLFLNILLLILLSSRVSALVILFFLGLPAVYCYSVVLVVIDVLVEIGRTEHTLRIWYRSNILHFYKSKDAKHKKIQNAPQMLYVQHDLICLAGVEPYRYWDGIVEQYCPKSVHVGTLLLKRKMFSMMSWLNLDERSAKRKAW